MNTLQLNLREKLIELSFDTENNISINVIGSDLNLPPKKIADFQWCKNQTYVLHDTLRPLNNGSEAGFHRILRLKSSEREILDIENPSEYCFFVAVTADRILISLTPRLVDNLIRLRQLKVVDSDVRDFTLKPKNGFFAVTRGTALRIITKRNPEAFEPSHFGVGVSSLKMLSGLESPSNIEDQLRYPGEIGRNFIHGCFSEFGQMAVKLSGMDSFLSAIIVKNVAQEYGYLNRVRAVHVEMDEHYLGGYQKLIVEEMVRYLGVELEVIPTQVPSVERIAKAGRNSGYESAVRLEDWPVDCPATAALIDWEAQQTDTLILGGGDWSARVEPFQSFNGTLEFQLLPGSSLSGLRRRLVFSPLGANSLFTLISRRQIDKREALASVAGALLFPTRRQGYTDYRLGWSHLASVTTPDERLLRLADQYLSSYPDGSAGSYLTLVKDQLFFSQMSMREQLLHSAFNRLTNIFPALDLLEPTPWSNYSSKNLLNPKWTTLNMISSQNIDFRALVANVPVPTGVRKRWLGLVLFSHLPYGLAPLVWRVRSQYR